MTGKPEPPPGPLAGVRIVDATHVLAGPFCTELLGDLGADVIKVEALEGDLTRSIGPRRTPGMSAQFLSLNRNKRSIALDLKQPSGRDVLLRLAACSQVFVTNMRRGALARLGIEYPAVAEASPSIVYCRIVGFGVEHPDGDKPVIDDVVQAGAGLVALQGELTGEPSFVALPMADMNSGMFAALGILAALYRRATTGAGEELEVPLYDAMASLLMTVHMSGSVFEPPLGPPTYARSVTPTRRPFRTADGAICAAPYSDRDWRNFLPLVGREDLLDDPRFNSVYARSSALEELYEIVEPLLATKTSAEWLEALAAADVPAGPVKTTADVLADPSLEAAGLFPRIESPEDGTLRLVGSPIRLSQAPAALRRHPPRCGEHTTEVLAELGYTTPEIDSLIASGVAGEPGSRSMATTN